MVMSSKGLNRSVGTGRVDSRLAIGDLRLVARGLVARGSWLAIWDQRLAISHKRSVISDQ
jgi:hypothetical protein